MKCIRLPLSDRFCRVCRVSVDTTASNGEIQALRQRTTEPRIPNEAIHSPCLPLLCLQARNIPRSARAHSPDDRYSASTHSLTISSPRHQNTRYRAEITPMSVPRLNEQWRAYCGVRLLSNRRARCVISLSASSSPSVLAALSRRVRSP